MDCTGGGVDDSCYQRADRMIKKLHNNRYLPLLLTLLLLGLAAFSLLSLLQAPTPVETIIPQKPVQKRIPQSINITSAHLFGKLQPVTENLPSADLSVVLQGIIFVEGSAARAIIGENNAAAKVYAVGDQISAGASIQTINKNNVVINQQGELRLLTLPVTPLGKR